MYVKAHVFPGMKREECVREGTVFRISVREPAQRNLANTRVRELIARELHVRLVNRSAVAKNAGATGEVVVRVVFEPFRNIQA